MRGFTRLTSGFSEKTENRAALVVHYFAQFLYRYFLSIENKQFICHVGIYGRLFKVRESEFAQNRRHRR